MGGGVLTVTKMRLLSEGDGHWKSEDGRVAIHRDSTFETECELAPHPVRLGRAEYAWYRGLDAWDKEHRVEPYEKRMALREGKRGYLCPGGETHYYTMWTVEVDGEWTDTVHDSFAEARGAVEENLGVTTVLVPKRKPKSEPEEKWEPAPAGTFATVIDTAGRATWVGCGHPAERDINDHCYICHAELERVLIA
jgi:hypothetical protein